MYFFWKKLKKELLLRVYYDDFVEKVTLKRKKSERPVLSKQ